MFYSVPKPSCGVVLTSLSTEVNNATSNQPAHSNLFSFSLHIKCLPNPLWCQFIMCVDSIEEIYLIFSMILETFWNSGSGNEQE